MADPSTARAKVRIGVLVPFTNTNIEPDFQAMCPPDVTFHFTRIGGYSEKEVPGADEMVLMGASGIDTALDLIAGCRPHAVIYGCTSATLANGRAFDLALASRIKAHTNAVTVTAAGAIIAGLRALEARTIALASPYTDEIDQRTVRYLADEGIRTCASLNLGANLLPHDQGEVTPDQVLDLALRADHPEARAIVLPCTDLRAVQAVDRIEATLGKPVITANQALIFAVTKELGIAAGTAVPGQLLCGP